MDLSIAGEQTDGCLPTHRPLNGRALWWVSALLLAGIIAIVLPIGQIKMLGAQLGGVIGSYTNGAHGHYDVAYSSDGTWADSNSTSSYSGTFVNGVSSSITGIDAWTKCGGTITATLTWVPGLNNELPPDCVIVQEASSVQLYKDVSGTGGALIADDGLGDVAIASSSGALSSGSRYTVRTSPGASFTVHATLKAKSSVSGANTYDALPPTPASTITGGVGCLLSYTATPTVPMINISGTTPTYDVNNQLLEPNNVLIGQHLDASLTIDTKFTPIKWAWTLTGDPFKEFRVDEANHNWSGKAVELFDPDKQQATVPYAYRSIGAVGADPLPTEEHNTQTVSCVVTVAAPSGPQLPLTITAKVEVFQPAHSMVTKLGALGEFPFQGVTMFGLAPVLPDAPSGVNWKGTVTSPDLFTIKDPTTGKVIDSGFWAYVQVISRTHMSKTVNPNQHQEATSILDGLNLPIDPLLDTDSRCWGLDKTFPYGSTVFPADSTAGPLGDSPSFQVFPNDLVGGIDFLATTYMFYKPIGANSTRVPLHYISWGVSKGTANLNPFGGATQNSIMCDDAPTSRLPFWDRILKVGNTMNNVP